HRGQSGSRRGPEILLVEAGGRRSHSSRRPVFSIPLATYGSARLRPRQANDCSESLRKHLGQPPQLGNGGKRFNLPSKKARGLTTVFLEDSTCSPPLPFW